MSNGYRGDIRKTIEEMQHPSGLVNGQNWLRHGGSQEIVIDEMCLKGATIEEMAKEIIKRGFDSNKKGLPIIINRVKKHIWHLKAKIDSPGRGHGLTLTKSPEHIWKLHLEQSRGR